MKSNMTKVGRKFRSLDDFGQRTAMKIDFEGAGSTYQSYMGATVSVIFFSISAIFLFSKIMVLYNTSSVTVINNFTEGAYT